MGSLKTETTLVVWELELEREVIVDAQRMKL